MKLDSLSFEEKNLIYSLRKSRIFIPDVVKCVELSGPGIATKKKELFKLTYDKNEQENVMDNHRMMFLGIDPDDTIIINSECNVLTLDEVVEMYGPVTEDVLQKAIIKGILRPGEYMVDNDTG